MKNGQEEFGEEEVAEVVGAELDFVAFIGETWWLRHDARVVHEDVEALIGVGEGLSGGFDGGEGAEVQFEVVDEVGGVWDYGGDAFHGGVVLGLGTGAEVDLGRVVWCEV